MKYTKIELALYDTQINKIKHARQNDKGVIITISKKQYEGIHDLYLTNSQIKKLRESPGDVRIKLSKTQVNAQKGGWLGALLKAALPILGSLGLSAASGAISGATSRAVQGRGLYRIGEGFTLYFNKEEVGGMLKTIKTLEENGNLKKGTCKACMKEINNQSGGFIGALLAGLASTILPMLFSKN